MPRLHTLAWTSSVALALLLLVACTVSPIGNGRTSEQNATSKTTVVFAQIDGTVAMKNGDPSGIDVAAYPVDSPPSAQNYATQTDRAGHFTLSVPVGTYNVIASKAGTSYRAVQWSVQSATTVNLNLTPTGSIAGRVTSTPPTDLSGTLVFVPGTSFVAATDANGRYTMTSVPVGTVSIEVRHTGYTKGTLASATIQAGMTTEVSDINLVLSSIAQGTSTPPPGQIGAVYVGGEACVNCHVSETEVYKKTAHYRVGNDPAFYSTWSGRTNKNCRSCHVVGEDATAHASPSAQPLLVNGLPAGFDFAKNAIYAGTGTWLGDPAQAKFYGIQCESCHGPGSNHIGGSMTDPDLIAKKLNTITAKPSYTETCVQCHTTTIGNVHVVNGSYVPWKDGALVSDINAGGAGSYAHHPQALIYQQSGGYTYGQTLPSSAHNKLDNGCIDCHVTGLPGANHDINIENNRAAVIANVCSKCHGATMTPATIQSYQAMTKLAMDALHDLMIAYRKAFCREVLVGTATSSAAVDIANLSYKATLWDDTPAGVTKVTGAATTWSPHQTNFNAAYWNWYLIEEEKSFGIHAPSYEQEMLRLSHNALVTDMGAANPTSTGSYSILSVGR